jgi:predicted signal transduction protein with EAL and GGDEF domain
VPRSSAIISSVVTLASGLGISVTAEAVETREQFERLRTLGVNFVQGYLLGRPVPTDELIANFSGSDYATGLRMLSRTITFFHQNPVFIPDPLPGLPPDNILAPRA